MMTCKSTGLLSASAVVSARPAMLHGIILLQASAAATVISYDNATTNSGTETCQVNTTTNASTNTIMFNQPVECLNGIYAAVTGSGAKFIVLWSMM